MISCALCRSSGVPYFPVFALVCLACDGSTETNDRCLVDLALISVPAYIVGIGDSVTFQVSLGPAECLPADVVTAEWRSSSSDTLVARIGSLTGVAEGVSLGEVTIQVQHAQNHSVSSGTGLRVVAATSARRAPSAATVP